MCLVGATLIFIFKVAVLRIPPWNFSLKFGMSKFFVRYIDDTSAFERSLNELLALDFGLARCGLAATDDLQLIASGLCTVPSKELMEYLKKYLQSNKVSTLVLGEPKFMDGSAMDLEQNIQLFIEAFKAQFPSIEVARVDERFTSKMAKQTLVDSGLKKKDRQNKALLDTISANLILQSYMAQKGL